MSIQGVFAPIPTPFTDTGELDFAGWRSNITRWMGTRLHGLVLLGSNGEAPLIDDDEAERLIGEARQQIQPDRLLIAGTGRESTRATIEASRRAGQVGADLVLVRTPSYFKSQLTTSAFIDHYTAVADASPVPVLLYNFTAVTGVRLPVEAVAVLAGHANIVGIKESGPDLSYVGDLVGLANDGFSVLVGSAPTFLSSLVLGAAGGILALASVAPDECLHIYDSVRAGSFDEALAMQRSVTPLAKLVTSVYGVPGLKAALAEIGYIGGIPRAPLLPLEDGPVAQIREQLAQLQSVSSSVVS